MRNRRVICERHVVGRNANKKYEERNKSTLIKVEYKNFFEQYDVIMLKRKEKKEYEARRR
jgi:Asp-tRNA(Asn)/Glu-tRNA(Gln) amidotransferase A subunit family amidase